MKRTVLALALLFATPSLAAETITDCRYMNAAQTMVRCVVNGQVVDIAAHPTNRYWQDITRNAIPVAAFE